MNLFIALKYSVKLFILLLLIGCFVSCTGNKKNAELVLNYPSFHCDSVTDNYFGKKVTDHYRALEKMDDPVVQQWMNLENKITDSVLNKISYRDSLHNKLEEMIYSSNVRGGFPRVVNKKLFFTRIFMKENIQKLFYRDSLSGKETELFSTASLTPKDQTIDYFEPSFDGKYIAFGVSSNGTERAVIKIMDVQKKELLPETIERVNYGTPFWVAGQAAFFYSQLKEIKTEEDRNTTYEDSKVKLHWVGTDPKNDKEIFSKALNKELPLDKIDFINVFTFLNSNKAMAVETRGSSHYASLYVASVNDLTNKNTAVKKPWTICCNADEKVNSFGVFDHYLFVLSFKDNPNGILKKIDLNDLSLPMVTLEQGNDEVLEDLMLTRNFLYLKKLKNGTSIITKIDPVKGTKENVELPFEGYIYLHPFFDVTSTYINSDSLYFAMESWNKEVGIFYYDPVSEKVVKTNLRAESKYGNVNDIVIKETEVPSHDGTMVPISIMYSKNILLDGKNPTMLEGYGAYGSSINAGFDLALLTWIKMGGIYAVAHVRGGGEKGDSWYKGGYKASKPNSWKDFIACAEYLIKNNYTSAEKLSAKGTSAGGIVVGRAITERPDLFKAAILEVSILNTVRFENTMNTLNVQEFGTAKDSSEFLNLLEMDTYLHIKNDVKYPALLIVGGLHDARVDIWQPAKAVAKFQDAAKTKPNVVLFKVNNGGHSGDEDKVKENTDYFSFLFWQLGQGKFKIHEGNSGSN